MCAGGWTLLEMWLAENHCKNKEVQGASLNKASELMKTDTCWSLRGLWLLITTDTTDIICLWWATHRSPSECLILFSLSLSICFSCLSLSVKLYLTRNMGTHIRSSYAAWFITQFEKNLQSTMCITMCYHCMYYFFSLLVSRMFFVHKKAYKLFH